MKGITVPVGLIKGGSQEALGVKMRHYLPRLCRGAELYP